MADGTGQSHPPWAAPRARGWYGSTALGAVLFLTSLAWGQPSLTPGALASSAPLSLASPPAVASSPSAASAPTEPAAPAPFGYTDFTWQNGQSRQRDFPLKPLGDVVTVSLYLDVYYAYSFHRPKDDTLTGTASVGRHNEFQINLASVGFDWNYKHVIGRVSLQYGTMLDILQDLDGSTARGRSLSTENLSFLREAALGYHADVDHGLNVEAGIFMSYIGLESYLLAENWNYHRALVGDFTPFYLQGLRVQYFPRKNLKIEPWLMNGYQTYGKWNTAPSVGLALRWSPTDSVGLILNTYLGTDTKDDPGRVRFHSDHSALVRYLDHPDGFLSKAAFSVNNHAGFESGGHGPGASKAYLLGTSIAHRLWFLRDKLSFTVRGEAITNKSRYTMQYPPPNLAASPGAPLTIYGLTGTLEVAPTDFFLVRLEGLYRRSDQRFFAGPGGTTSPDGYQGTPGDFTPDGRKDQMLVILAANFRL